MPGSAAQGIDFDVQPRNIFELFNMCLYLARPRCCSSSGSGLKLDRFVETGEASAVWQQSKTCSSLSALSWTKIPRTLTEGHPRAEGDLQAPKITPANVLSTCLLQNINRSQTVIAATRHTHCAAALPQSSLPLPASRFQPGGTPIRNLRNRKYFLELQQVGTKRHKGLH